MHAFFQTDSENIRIDSFDHYICVRQSLVIHEKVRANKKNPLIVCRNNEGELTQAFFEYIIESVDIHGRK